MVEFVLKMPPRGKKNSRPIFKNKKTGKMFLGKDKVQRSYEASMITAMKEIMEAQVERTWPLEGSVEASYHISFKGYQRSDFDNVLAMINDCAQEAGLFLDSDRQIRRVASVEVCDYTGEDRIVARFASIEKPKKLASKSKKLSEIAALFRRE